MRARTIDPMGSCMTLQAVYTIGLYINYHNFNHFDNNYIIFFDIEYLHSKKYFHLHERSSAAIRESR